MMINQKNVPRKTLALAALLVTSQVAPGAVFVFRTDTAGDDNTVPGSDGQTFQQRWGTPNNWTLQSGVDDGANGYPDASDSIIMDRTGVANNSTRLTTEGSPGSLVAIASITGTGTGNQDIVFKTRDFTIGDLNSLSSSQPFHIRAERDKSITITGLIGGPGSLRLSRSGGFSDGVDPDELITITGGAANTITGAIQLFNDSAEQPSFWVADKVGAFGQASTVTLAATNGAATGEASLRITSNAIGGEGAIDDDATILEIGNNGILSLDPGVNEVIGEGNLLVDLGSGLAPIAPGVYTNAEPWLAGAGTLTVGAVVPEPSSLALAALSVLGLARRKR
jgi:hypothetical protein